MNTYLKKHRESGLKVGDKVKIIQKDEPEGWNEYWVDGMDKNIGLQGVIDEDYGDSGFTVSALNTSFDYPCTALERVYENND